MIISGCVKRNEKPAFAKLFFKERKIGANFREQVADK